jgi:hypothetical protein
MNRHSLRHVLGYRHGVRSVGCAARVKDLVGLRVVHNARDQDTELCSGFFDRQADFPTLHYVEIVRGRRPGLFPEHFSLHCWPGTKANPQVIAGKDKFRGQEATVAMTIEKPAGRISPLPTNIISEFLFLLVTWWLALIWIKVEAPALSSIREERHSIQLCLSKKLCRATGG